MEYPIRLVPKATYKHLDIDKLNIHSEKYYIIRRTRKNLKGLLKEEIQKDDICGASEALELSVNLRGVFLHRDIGWILKKDNPNYDLYRGEWSKDKDGIVPENIYYNKNNGFLYYNISQLHNKIVPDEGKVLDRDFDVRTILKHKPNKINFWHCEIHWEPLEKITEDSKTWRTKTLVSFARSHYKNIGYSYIPKYCKKMPKSFYHKNSG